MKEVNIAGPYYYATIVCLTAKDSRYANAKSIADLAGGKCTAQSGTIYYNACLPQIQDANIQIPAETTAEMLMQLENKTVDFVCTDMPTAMGMIAKNPNLTILNFSGTEGDFKFASEQERDENINVGISVLKGNGELTSLINKALSNLNEKHFNALMEYAIAIQLDN
jgi:ABC-type amino acid transport substrate-binding protein